MLVHEMERPPNQIILKTATSLETTLHATGKHNASMPQHRLVVGVLQPVLQRIAFTTAVGMKEQSRRATRQLRHQGG